MYAQLAQIGPGSIFGLESVFQKPPTRLSLVSQGAECIFISKKFFLKESTAGVLNVASELLVSYPAAPYIRQRVKEQRDWQDYKKSLIQDVVARRPGTGRRPDTGHRPDYDDSAQRPNTHCGHGT